MHQRNPELEKYFSATCYISVHVYISAQTSYNHLKTVFQIDGMEIIIEKFLTLGNCFIKYKPFFIINRYNEVVNNEYIFKTEYIDI